MTIRRGVVAVVPNGPRLLIIQRSLLVRAPGKFCFPGGGIEPGESEPEALLREVREEVGLVVEARRRLWRSTTPSGVQLAWWLASLPYDQPLELDPAEVAQACWLTPPQIRELADLLPTNHQFLDAWERGQFQLPRLLAIER